jgi:hypothetical protein
MKNRNKLLMLLNSISGLLFLLTALIGKNNTFIPIGCCFITLGLLHGKGRKQQ